MVELIVCCLCSSKSLHTYSWNEWKQLYSIKRPHSSPFYPSLRKNGLQKIAADRYSLHQSPTNDGRARHRLCRTLSCIKQAVALRFDRFALFLRHTIRNGYFGKSSQLWKRLRVHSELLFDSNRSLSMSMKLKSCGLHEMLTLSAARIYSDPVCACCYYKPLNSEWVLS